VREKKLFPDWRVGLYFYSPILNSTRIWRVGKWFSAPLQVFIEAAIAKFSSNGLVPMNGTSLFTANDLFFMNKVPIC
jgi:hypothetical protein